ncbi:acyl-ACP thioesterase domain-containing protein, partial [Nocardia salmonicida]|uniref:acyl-ACP thioesterase domain-containing protein n=1 Tax=Nocardia salmonicida TaxID=53431 RepID=UPI003646801D
MRLTATQHDTSLPRFAIADHYTLNPSPVGADAFHARYRIRTSDTDHNNRLRLDAVARYLQDIAADMLEASSFATSDPHWIIRRTIIDVVKPIAGPGVVDIRRWCSATSSRWVNMRQTLRATHDGRS